MKLQRTSLLNSSCARDFLCGIQVTLCNIYITFQKHSKSCLCPFIGYPCIKFNLYQFWRENATDRHEWNEAFVLLVRIKSCITLLITMNCETIIPILRFFKILYWWRSYCGILIITLRQIGAEYGWKERQRSRLSQLVYLIL